MAKHVNRNNGVPSAEARSKQTGTTARTSRNNQPKIPRGATVNNVQGRSRTSTTSNVRRPNQTCTQSVPEAEPKATSASGARAGEGAQRVGRVARLERPAAQRAARPVAEARSKRTATNGSANSAYARAASTPYSRDNQMYQFRVTEQRAAKKRKKRLKVVGIIAAILVVLVGVLGFTGYTAYNSAKTLKSEASSIMSGVDVIKSSVKSGEYEAAQTAASTMQKTAANMKEELESPLFSFAGVLPVVGSDVSGVKEVVDVLNDVCEGALTPLTNALVEYPVSDMIKDDGSIDVNLVQQMLSVVETTAPVMQDASDRLNAVPTMNISQLESTMGPAKEKFSEINELFQKGADIAPIMGTLLGVDGDRHYLIAAQNSAEIRSTGGFPGAVGILSISNGKIDLGDFGTPYDLMADETSLITDEEKSLFQTSQFDVTIPRDSGIIPNFPHVAEIWGNAYTEKSGNSINGVVSVTPSVVQDMLKIAGQITLSDGTVLNGDNATRVLESELYWKYLARDTKFSGSGDVCDALFSEASGLAFKKTLGSLNAKSLFAMAQTFFDDFDNNTFMIWLNNADEQAKLETLNCSGRLNSEASEPVAGIYIGQIYGSKMSYYLDAIPTIGEGVKNADGTTSYTVTLSMANTMNPDDVDAAGTYIAGDTGGMDPTIYLFAPAGGTISDIQSSWSFSEHTYEGLQFFATTDTWLSAGDSETITYTVTVSAQATTALSITETPTLTNYR